VSYFNLRKRDPEPEPEPDELDEVEQPDDAEDEDTADAPKRDHGPIVTGLLGPGRWLTARFNLDTSIIIHTASMFAVLHYGGWIAAGLILLWLLAVAAFVPREALERAAAAIERRHPGTRRKTAPTPADAAAPGGEREAVRRLLLDLIGDAHGVHLKTVLAHLQEHGQWEGRKVADLRVHLEALGIPVDPKLKVAGVPTRGVLRTALEALPPVEETSPSPTPSPPV